MNKNELALNERTVATSVGSDLVTSRQAQEVQAAMVIAQKFPRDTNKAYKKIINDCKRKSLAKKAVYAYPRGKEMVTGPSIRLAEVIARAWCNLDFGVIELENKPGIGNLPGESVVMTYCWDLESNTRDSKVFTVKHRRDTKGGGYALTDGRDIYEQVANQAARRKRANILAIIPHDIIEAALEECDRTLAGGEEPLVDRIREMIVAFGDIGVNQDMIQKRLGHKVDVTSEAELVQMRKIYNSISDNFADRADFFEVGPVAVAPASSNEPAPTAELKSISSHYRSGKESTEAPAAPAAAAPAPSDPDSFENAASGPPIPPVQKPTREQLAKVFHAEAKRLKMSKEAKEEFIRVTTCKVSNELTDDELFTITEILKRRTV